MLEFKLNCILCTLECSDSEMSLVIPETRNLVTKTDMHYFA